MSTQQIGTILTQATTQSAQCQLYEGAERGKVREGMFVIVTSQKRRILARIASLTPENEFYSPGDAWTEARRKQWKIPEQVARRYELCELDLLGEVPGMRSVSIPPYPGDLVILIDPSKASEEIFATSNPSRGIVWYGSLVGYQNVPIPLDIERIPMHLAVFGTTGSGKSYDVGALVEQLVKIFLREKMQVSFPMLIIDANGDYLDYVKHFADKGPLGSCPKIVRYVFPHSPDAVKKASNVETLDMNLSKLLDRELSELIVQYYSGGEKNELQVTGLEDILELMEVRSDITEGDYQKIFTDNSMFEQAKKRLVELEETKAIHSQTAPAILRALEKFKDIQEYYGLLPSSPKIDDSFIDMLTRNREIAIIDFSTDGAPGIPLSVKQLVVSYLSSILYARFTKYKTDRKARYLLFVIEEAQNYCPNLSQYNVGSSLAREKLSVIATQGRKFGLSLCLVSQRPSFVDPVVLSMCNTFFIHRISPEDVGFVRRVSGGLPDSLDRRLTLLETGEVIVVGQLNRAAFPLLIKVSKANRQVPHTAGATEVSEALESSITGSEG